jgi:hypothetical protein
MGLIEEERDERHVPGRAGLQPVEDVFMSVSSEGTPIVPGHRECLSESHACPTPRPPAQPDHRVTGSSGDLTSRPGNPVDAANSALCRSEQLSADGSQGDADHGSSDHIRGVVGPEIKSAEPDQSGA